MSGMSMSSGSTPPGVATAARRPTGASATSTRTLKPRMRSCRSGGTPEPSHSRRRDDDVDDDLRGEGQQVHPPQVEVRVGTARRREHHRGTDDVPRVAEREQGVVRVHGPGDVLGHAVEQRRRDHRDHGDPGRQGEQHDDEHRLGGTGHPAADAELHATGRDVGDDAGDEVQRCRQGCAGRDREAGHGEDEREPDGSLDHALARRQRRRCTGRRVAHELLDDRVVVDVHGPLAG
jgi:hypothetical protein